MSGCSNSHSQKGRQAFPGIFWGCHLKKSAVVESSRETRMMKERLPSIKDVETRNRSSHHQCPGSDSGARKLLRISGKTPVDNDARGGGVLMKLGDCGSLRSGEITGTGRLRKLAVWGSWQSRKAGRLAGPWVTVQLWPLLANGKTNHLIVELLNCQSSCRWGWELYLHSGNF